MMEALTTIAGFVKSESHRKAVIKHAEMVLRQGEATIKEENDLVDLATRATILLRE